MEFKISIGNAIPAAALNRASTHKFPWDDMAAKADKGQEPDITVPKDYWVKERGVPAKDYDALKARERIRMHFRGWQEKEADRAGYMLAMRTHPAGDIQVWMKAGAAPVRKHKTGSTAKKTK